MTTEANTQFRFRVGMLIIVVIAGIIGMKVISLEKSTGVPLIGQVALQDFRGDITSVPVYFEINKPGATTIIEMILLNRDGKYQLNVTKGHYKITVQGSHWLRKTSKINITNDVTGLNVSLINGDVDGDNGVDLSDENLVKSAIGSRSGHRKWNADADLDGNGKIDKADLFIVKKNFGKVGDS